MLLMTATKQERTCQIILLVAGYVFYAYADYRFLEILLAQTMIAYCTAGIIVQEKKGKNTQISIDNGGNVLRWSIVNMEICSLLYTYFESCKGGYYKAALPLGISFYTFQALSYMVDVYQKRKSWVWYTIPMIKIWLLFLKNYYYL